MRVFAVSGFSFSGKTFLLEQLITKLKEEGLTIASIKSTREDIVAPRGTDTWRHAQVGANPTMLIGPSTATLRFKGRPTLSELEKFFDVDFILLEGFKELDIPRFWCIGEETKEEAFTPSRVKAYVVWEGVDRTEFEVGVPVIANSEIDQLIEILKREAIEFRELIDDRKEHFATYN